MSKIGRNELCPCGSGKKYKKCCMEKTERAFVEGFSRYLQSFWSYEDANKMSTAEIIQRLESMGIIFDKDAFLRDIEKFYSAYELSENWFRIFRVTAKDRDEDFPFFAAWILWERLAPAHILSMEQMSDLIDEGFEYLSENDSQTACDTWLKIWEAVKFRHKPEFRNLDYLDEQYNRSFFIRNFCQDLEHELHNAGVENKTYFEKRINYCREFLDYFPAEDELIVHNTKRAIAESYLMLDNYEQAESEYERLVNDYPDNPWGYVGWGDMYFYNRKKDYARAKEFYEKGLAIANDKTDRMALEERLKDLEHAMRTKS